MASAEYVQYQVTLEWDEETRQMVAVVDTLDIGDCGEDTESAIAWLHKMVEFHVECLIEEGNQLPDSDEGEGFYIRTPVPAHAR